MMLAALCTPQSATGTAPCQFNHKCKLLGTLPARCEFRQCDHNLPWYDKAIGLPWRALADKLKSVNANREAAVLFMVLAAILAILLIRLSGPRLQPADAPDTVFSSARAVQELHDLLINDAPHPVGTAAHDAVLARLVTSFQERGYQPEVRRGFGCTADAVCAPVAILEAARPVRHERFRNTIRFLITDGEEAGLLGAEAIARDSQFLRGVAAVI